MFMRWPSFRPVQSLCSPCAVLVGQVGRLSVALLCRACHKDNKKSETAHPRGQKISLLVHILAVEAAALPKPPASPSPKTAKTTQPPPVALSPAPIIYIGISFSPVIKCKFAILNKYFANCINLLTLYSIAT